MAATERSRAGLPARPPEPRPAGREALVQRGPARPVAGGPGGHRRRPWACVNRYPEPARAVDALARYAGISPDRLILTNGSDELCYLVATLFLGPGGWPWSGDPCYQIDATASLVSGASVRRVPLRRRGARPGGHGRSSSRGRGRVAALAS